jgi:outer membrane protein TolC
MAHTERKRHATCTDLILLSLVPFLVGCNDTGNLAPATPESPWQTTVLTPDSIPVTAPRRTPAAALTAGALPGRYDLPHDRSLPITDNHPAIDIGHAYSLVELVDIAQRNNKQTRIAWEQARQAAIEVGISKAAYLPEITLSALGGYQRQVMPFPSTLSPKGSGYITSNADAIFPAVTISYLLFDFGGRAAGVAAARQASYASNVSFTGAHQQVILDVSRA